MSKLQQPGGISIEQSTHSALYCPFLHLRHDADADEGDGSDADDDIDDSHKC